jgi:hypothetical protein
MNVKNKRLQKKAFEIRKGINSYTGQTIEEQRVIIEEALKGFSSGKVEKVDLGDENEQYVVHFPNGFSISIINTSTSYGVEAALLKNSDVVYDDGEFTDVRGYLSTEELKGLIEYVKGLHENHESGEDYGLFKKEEISEDIEELIQDSIDSYKTKKKRKENLENLIMDAYSKGDKERAKELQKEYNELKEIVSKNKRLMKKAEEVVRIKPQLKDKINDELSKYNTKDVDSYFNEIPLDEIFNVLKEYNIIVVQEDGTEWEGMLTGTNEKTTFKLMLEENGERKEIDNAILSLSWYKFEDRVDEENGKYNKGRYEIVVYLA